jgi:hypothetical protein
MANESGSTSTKLGTVTIQSNVAGTQLSFPVDLELFLSTSPSGAKIGVVANVGLANLQNSFDSIAKSLPMPNDTSGYGTKIVASVESASLRSAGDTAVLEANINVTVWQIEKGIPGGGTTVRWETRCVDLGWPVGRVCTDVPVSVEIPPGPDIKLELVKEGVNANVALSLATPDGTSIEIRPGPTTVTPRGDIGKFFNDVAGIFNQNLSAQAQKEIAEIVNDGTLRQALPQEILAFNPNIAGVQFLTRPDGSLGALVDFRAMLTPEQLTEWIQKSVGK